MTKKAHSVELHSSLADRVLTLHDCKVSASNWFNNSPRTSFQASLAAWSSEAIRKILLASCSCRGCGPQNALSPPNSAAVGSQSLSASLCYLRAQPGQACSDLRPYVWGCHLCLVALVATSSSCVAGGSVSVLGGAYLRRAGGSAPSSSSSRCLSPSTPFPRVPPRMTAWLAPRGYFRCWLRPPSHL